MSATTPSLCFCRGRRLGSTRTQHAIRASSPVPQAVGHELADLEGVLVRMLAVVLAVPRVAPPVAKHLDAARLLRRQAAPLAARRSKKTRTELRVRSCSRPTAALAASPARCTRSRIVTAAAPHLQLHVLLHVARRHQHVAVRVEVELRAGRRHLVPSVVHLRSTCGPPPQTARSSAPSGRRPPVGVAQHLSARSAVSCARQGRAKAASHAPPPPGA